MDTAPQSLPPWPSRAPAPQRATVTPQHAPFAHPTPLPPVCASVPSSQHLHSQTSYESTELGSARKKRRVGVAGQWAEALSDAVRSEGSDSCAHEARTQEPEPHAQLPPVPTTLLGKLCAKPLHAYIAGGESSDQLRKRMRATQTSALLQSEGWAGLPDSWRERRVSTLVAGSQASGLTRTCYDKAFCVEWVGSREAAVSTKCGHVLRVDRQSGKIREVDLPGCRWIEPPIVTEEDLQCFRVDRGGIHCVRANASQSMLACSGGRCEQNNVYVLDLKHDAWQAVRQGSGHANWVFCLSWISDTSFVTGSRDKTVQLWNPQRSRGYAMKASAMYNDVHSAKVRCCGYDAPTGRLATLDVTGHVVLWDPHGDGDMRTLRNFTLDPTCREECTCMLHEENMLAIGAREHVSIYDPRRKKDSVANVPLAKIGYSGGFPAPNTSSGTIAARSIGSRGCMLSIGLSTSGGLIFIDRRKMSTCVADTRERASRAKSKYSLAIAACATRTSDAHMPPHDAAVLQHETFSAGGDGSAASHAAASSPEPARYNIRKRSQLRVPARYAASLDNTAGVPHAAAAAQRANGLFDTAPPTHTLTSHLPPSAILRQPHSDVHFDEVAEFNFGRNIDNAVFSHAWAPDGRGVFVCGGPLAMGVRGCYMSLWS